MNFFLILFHFFSIPNPFFKAWFYLLQYSVTIYTTSNNFSICSLYTSDLVSLVSAHCCYHLLSGSFCALDTLLFEVCDKILLGLRWCCLPLGNSFICFCSLLGEVAVWDHLKPISSLEVFLRAAELSLLRGEALQWCQPIVGLILSKSPI